MVTAPVHDPLISVEHVTLVPGMIEATPPVLDPLAAAVTRPFASTVMLAFVKLPTFELTVVNVNATEPVPGPAVASPVN
jgi:hypothetical protein